MKRVVAILLALSLSPAAEAGGWRDIASGWREIQTPPGFATMPAPSGCAAGYVPYFDSSLKLVCSPTVYAPTTNTTTVGTLAAQNVTATGLATPGSITVTPTLTQVGSITTVAGAALVDGDYFTIKYDGGEVPIEFDLSPGDGTTDGRIPYVFAPGDTADQIRDGLITLLNAAAPTKLTASSGGAATVALVLDTPGREGDTNTENVGDGTFAVTGFADPTAATTYTYKLVARLADGSTTEAGAASTTAAGHATLSAANYNALSWSAVSGAASYDVYRTVGGATQGKIASATTALSLSDTGLAGGGETAPTVDTTGRLTGDSLSLDGGSLVYDPATDALTSGATILGKTTATKSTLYTDSVRIPGQPVTVLQSVPDALPTILDLFPSTIDGAVSASAMSTGNTWIDLVDRDLNRSLNTTDWAAARISIYAAGTRTGKGTVTIGAVAGGAVDVPDLSLVGSNIFVAPLAFFVGDGGFWWRTGSFSVDVPIKSTQYKLSALNTAPSSASDTGTLGEIRVTATHLYVCTATNTWVRTALATW